MDECIKRDLAFNAVLKLVPKVDDDGYCWVIRGDVAKAIDSIPAADVRHVVLCRDCQHWDTDWVPNPARENEHFCPYIGLTTREDWFCADGEKREES